MNVVLFVIDTLRADHLGCYGYFRDTTRPLTVARYIEPTMEAYSGRMGE